MPITLPFRLPIQLPGHTNTPSGAFVDAVVESDAVPADLGSDVLVMPDLDTTFTPRGDAVVVADAFARRLDTRRGTLWSAPNYGFFLRDFLNDVVTPDTLQQIRAGIEAQAEQEERILGLQVGVAYDIEDQVLVVRMQVVSDAGPFALALTISQLTTDVLVEA